MNRKKNQPSLRVIPLGGLGEVGKNMCVVEYGNDIIIIDAGLTFPDETMPGVDVVIPDITYLKKNKSKIKGLLLTHGHEDHYGAVGYVLDKIQTNVYCTRLTGGLLENKFKEQGHNPNVIKYVKAGDVVKLGALRCEFIHVAHSIPDACSIAVTCPVGTVVFTGDFKMDFTPIDHAPTDIHRLAELGREGVLAVYTDSTNVEHKGYSMSEKTVGETFNRIFAQSRERIIVATFASNLHRVQQIIWAAEANGRKVCLNGRSMLNNVRIADELGYLKIKKNTLIDPNEIRNYKPKELVLLITGSQGEPMSALSRMANDAHRQISLNETDTVILSASMIPGNEKSIGDMINKLMAHGCDLIYSDLAEVHTSGHACQEELKLMFSLLAPKYLIPAHGEVRMQVAQKKLGMSLGIPEDQILMGENGTVFSFSGKGDDAYGKVDGKVPAGQILVDGLGIGDVGSVVLNDRKRLSEDGMIAVVVTLDNKTRKLVAGPEIISRGFIYLKENVDIIEEIKKITAGIFDNAARRNITDWNFLKSQVREEVKSYVYTETHRDPIVLSIIMETEKETAKR